MTDNVFVYTMDQLGAKGSWSRYVFPWAISNFAHLANDMFMRHGDQVSIVVDSDVVDEVVGDAESAFESITPPAQPSGALTRIAMSENLMAIGSDTSPYLTIFDRSDDTYTAASAPTTLPTGTVNGVAISPDEEHVAVAMDTSPYFAVFKVDRYGAWNKLSNPASLPTDTCYSVVWSDDGQHVFVVGLASPYVIGYKLTAETLTRLADLPGTHATGAGYSLAYSGSDLAVGYTATPFLKAFKRAGDTYSAVSINGTNPTELPGALSFSPNFLACSASTGQVLLFERTGPTLTRTTITEPNVGTTIQGLAFSAGGDVLAVGKAAQAGEYYYSLWTYDGAAFSEVDVSALTDAGAAVVSVGFGGNYIGILEGADVEVVKWNGAAAVIEQEYEGVLHWPWLDFGAPGVHKMLHGFDNVGTGTSSIEFGYDQSNLATFTASYAIPADSMPGTIIPMPLTAPSVSVKLTYDGGQAWLWNATTLYMDDDAMGAL